MSMKRMWSKGQVKNLSKEVIESGQVDNAKPIYCHPISIDYEGEDVSNPVHLALLIFDNSNDEYNTYDKFIAKINSIFDINENAVFPITGAIYYESGSTLHIAQKIGKRATGPTIFTCRPDGTQGTFTASIYINNATFYDGVNKIN